MGKQACGQAMAANGATRRTPPQRWRAALCTGLVLAAGAARATEGGGNSYPVGVETNYNGLMPAEGLYPYLYYAHYTATSSRDNAGHDNPALANFRLHSNVAAARLSYVWPTVRLFGATVETRIVQSVADVDLNLAIARPAALGPLDRSGGRTGLADTSFSPIILGWHNGTYHQTVGLDTHLKVGAYGLTDRVNIGRNYYQFAPLYALTWFPTQRVDINAKLRYAINTRNKDTDYKSGNEATLEFSAGYRISPAFALGINGYLYRQTTDDVQHGIAVNGNGNRGRVNALGPYISYNFTPKIMLIIKVQSEFDARNRPQGTRLWSQIKIPL